MLEATGPSLDVLVSGLRRRLRRDRRRRSTESEVTDLVDTLVFVAQPAAET
ncbi:MAG: hypothetical protein R3E53_14395 [Myxococcota bacterium]